MQKFGVPMPTDQDGRTLPLIGPGETLAKSTISTLSTAQVITLHAQTAVFEVNAINQGIYVKKNGTATSSDFTRFCQAGQTIHIVVPTDATTYSLLEQSSGASAVVLEYSQQP